MKAFGQTENGLERGFVKHGLDSVEITGPVLLTAYHLKARPLY